MDFQPDYRNIVDAARNLRPRRLPLYEHVIADEIMEQVLGENVALQGASAADYRARYDRVCAFWKRMTYDTVSYEAGICAILPGNGAIMGGKAGPIQNRADFNAYPFDDVPRLFWEKYTPHLDALRAALPEGMKLIGGCGTGVFEISEDLVGYEWLCMLQYDDPELFADLYKKIGDLMITLLTQLYDRYGDLFCVGRMGDDLGFKSSTLLAPEIIIQHIIPQYKRIITFVHSRQKPFLLHSCGCIFSVMEEILSAGIDAKHSNEDQIAPFTDWIARYSGRIGLFGGIDVNVLCQKAPKIVYAEVLKQGSEYRKTAKGHALGSGNSIPNYVPVEGYLAMVEAAKAIRKQER